MLLNILPPREIGNYPDRSSDCQESIVDDEIGLIERAEKAGSSTREVAAANGVIARALVKEQNKVVIDNNPS